jgi:hypothetical protein
MNDTALIVCGALAREVLALIDKHGWDADVYGLPVLLHNTPHKIPLAVDQRIKQLKQVYRKLIVVYGDCGTSGELDQILDRHGVQRVPGPHCYQMYADGSFDKLMQEQPGTFFLTDYLVGSFDHLVLENLGLDLYPNLRDEYFRNYSRVVYLSQRGDDQLEEKAYWAADQIGLPLEIKKTGYGLLEKHLITLMDQQSES